ncbi:MAG: PhnD/SsuA/transferrin family substrate-binding protein [Bryobacteraceae bacterium]
MSEAIATSTPAPLRMAISESVVAEVNLNDARAAMQVFLQRLAQEYNFRLEYNPRIFDASGEILDRTRRGTVDAVVVNILEYRQIAGLLDPSQIVVGAGAKGRDQYVILVKRDGVIKKLDDLRGRRLVMKKGYRMCVAPYWLSTLFQEGQRVPIEQILGAAIMEVKISRVVLPVFFGSADACLAHKQGFEMICELNPQVAKDLTILAVSPPMVVTLQAFSRNYRGVYREMFITALSSVGSTAAGPQLATLFQSQQMVVSDGACLTPALAVIEKAERARGKR